MDSTDSATDFTVIVSTTTPDNPGTSGSQPCDLEEKIPATPQVDSFFNFQLVVFQVYSVFFMLRSILQHYNRLGIHFFK